VFCKRALLTIFERNRWFVALISGQGGFSFGASAITRMRHKLYGIFLLILGAFLLLSGLGRCFFKVTGRHFPDGLDWWWGTISYSEPYGTINLLVDVILGIGLIGAGHRALTRSR
jgi:hypothetical protein